VTAAIATHQLAGISLSATPVLAGATAAALPLSQTAIGGLAALELLLTALVTAVVAGWTIRLAWRPLAAGGAAALILGLLGHGIAVDGPSVGLCRVLMGVGSGALGAVGAAAIASAPDPDRVFGLSGVAGGLLGVAVHVLLPGARAEAGLVGVGLLLALVAGILSLAIIRLAPLTPARHLDKTGNPTAEPSAPLITPARCLFLVAVAAFFLPGSGIWVHGDLMAERAGLSPSARGGLYAAMIAASILGSGAVALWGTRFGRRSPMAACLAISAVATGAVFPATDAIPFAAAMVASSLTFSAGIAYVLGLAAVLDPAGRLPGLAVAVGILAYGVSAIAIPAAVATLGGVGQAALTILVGLAATVVLVRLDRPGRSAAS